MSQKEKNDRAGKMGSFLASLILMIFVTIIYTVSVVEAEEASITTLTDEQKEDLEERQDELDDIEAKIKAYKQIVDLKQRQGTALSDQIESLEAQASSLELQIGLKKRDLGQIESEVRTLADRVAQKEDLIVRQKGLLSEIMRSYYADQTNIISNQFIVSTSEMANPLQENEWISETGGKVSELLSSVKTLRESLLKEQAILVEKQKTTDTLKLQLEEQSARLDSTKESKATLLTKTQSEAKKYDALVDDLERQREEVADEIESLESGKIDALNTKDIPAFKKGLLIYPLKKVIITQSYGKTSFAKKSGFYGKTSFHNGVDFAAPSGTSVYAAASGKIIAIGNNGKYAYGRYIAVDHGNGLVTMYGHLSSVTKKLGDKVQEGDTIAKSGNTGNSTGPHVHFTVFSAKSFDVVPSKSVSSVKDIPIGATVNPKVYLP